MKYKTGLGLIKGWVAIFMLPVMMIGYVVTIVGVAIKVIGSLMRWDKDTAIDEVLNFKDNFRFN